MKLKVITSDRREVAVTADNYDALELHEQLNDESRRTVVIGNNIFDRTDVRRVIVDEDNSK